MSTTSFIVATEKAGPGRGGWYYLRIYDSHKDLLAAARRYQPWARDIDAKTLAMVQFVPRRERVGKNRRWESVPQRNKLCGVIRIFRPFTIEILAHEMLHAAMGCYRFMVERDATFGENCLDSEEHLAYITGELFDQALGKIWGTIE